MKKKFRFIKKSYPLLLLTYFLVINLPAKAFKPTIGLTKTETPVLFGKLTYVTGFGFENETPDLRIIPLHDNKVGFPKTPVTYKNLLKQKGEKITIHQKYENILTIELPENKHCVALLVMDNARTINETVVINKPQLQWLSTDRAWKKDTVRALGKGLTDISMYPERNKEGKPVSYADYMNTKTRVAIKSSDNQFHWCEVVKASAYDIHFIIPENVPSGDAEVFVHGGFSGQYGWSDPQEITIAEKPEWPDKVFNVQKFGAAGDGITDDTKAVEEAIAALRENNGGVLYFPAGGYHVNATFRLPDKTVVKGESRERSWIFLPDGFHTNATDSSVKVVFAGEGAVGMENLSIHAVYISFVLMAPVSETIPENWVEFAWNSDSVNASGDYSFVKNCRFLHNRTHLYHRRNDDPLHNFFERKNHVNVLLRGNYIEIIDSEFQAKESNVYLCDSRYSRIAGNTMHSGHGGNNIALQHGSIGYEKIIIEDNVLDGIVPTHHGSVWMMHGGKNLYLANNDILRQFWVSDNEGLLGHMWGWRLPLYIKKVYDDQMEIDIKRWDAYWETMYDNIGKLSKYFPFNKLNKEQNDFSIYEGKEVQVFRGQGLGQVNHIQRIEGNMVYFEKPFKTPLTKESFLVMHEAPAFRHITFAKNRIEDTGQAIFLWGHSHEIVIDGNSAVRTGPIGPWTVYHAYSVAGGCHFFQIINNYCNEGRSLYPGQHKPGGRYVAGGIGAQYSCESSWASGGGALNYVGYIIRNNYLENDCAFNYPGYDYTWCQQAFEKSGEKEINPYDFTGISFEDNVNKNCKYGMVFGTGVKAILKNNEFINVENEIEGKDDINIISVPVSK
jgi:hypothetical protein